MSRLRGAKAFKKWINRAVLDDPESRALLCRNVFALDPAQAEELDWVAEYVRQLAERFLHADSYKAAKHGLALRGGSHSG